MHPPPVISYLCIQGTINISHAILYPLLYMYFIKIMSNKLGNLLAYVCSHCILLKHFSTLFNSKAKKHNNTRSYYFLHKASNLVCHSFRIFVCTPA